MRGTILGFDAASGTGAINDLSGGRLRFGADAWRGPGEPIPGRLVDFEVADGEAIDIYPVPGGGGAGPIGFGGDDPARSAMTAGIISLVCALVSFVIPHLGIFTLVAAVAFGIKGKNLGRDLPDRTAYYLSIAGLLISSLALLVILLTLAACVGVLGVIGLSTAVWN
ncbi:MAG: hypothetical protein V4574_21755 [Pseudomonadota bacterium]